MISIPAVNWPLFVFTSLVICLRAFAPSLCLWLLNRVESPSKSIDNLAGELKSVLKELERISQQDEFAAYTRKERQRNTLVQRLKDERSGLENKQKTLLTYIRLSLNLGTILMTILLTLTGRRHQSMPLFHFPFFHFPLIVWVAALNTFVTTLSDIIQRYQTNKNTVE